MKALTDEQGNRVVAAVKDGGVSIFINKKPQFAGKLDLESYSDLMEEELKPLRKKDAALQKEYQILTATKARDLASTKRIDKILGEQNRIGEQMIDIRDKYNPNELNNKVFTDSNGKRWTIGEATTKEIEANTNVKYHKNAVLNNLVHYNDLRKIDRATQYLEGIKNSPEFNKVGMKIGEGVPPTDWKTTQLPQFRGYFFDPKVADSLDHLNKQMYKQSDPLKALTEINRFLRTSIFFNPLIHTPNIAVHWIVNRGVSKFVMPKEYATLWKTSARAIDAVMQGNDDYIAMLESGVNLMYSDQQGDTLANLMNQKMGEQMQDPEVVANLKKIWGNINPYKISAKVTWATNDLATMQAIYEEVENGRTLDEAIKEVGKHIPNYVMPSRIMNSKAVATLMSNPNITMFGAYHYGALKSYVEMAKSGIKGTPKEKLEALDKLAMLALIMFVIYPALDKVVRAITGNDKAHLRRAGTTTIPENIFKMASGKIDFSQVLQSIMTPAVGAKEGLELAFNRDFFTGKKVLPSGEEMEGLKDFALQTVVPLNATQRIVSGKISLSDYLMSMTGISLSDPNKGKWYSMIDSKEQIQSKIDILATKDEELGTRKAADKAYDFNIKQLKKLLEIKDEEKLTDIPDSTINRITVGNAKTDYDMKSKDLGMVLSPDVVASKREPLDFTTEQENKMQELRDKITG